MNAIVANDETLMAIYPKIRGMPDEQRKAQDKEKAQKNQKQNTQTLLTKEKLQKFTKNKEREEYNRELKRLVELEVQNEKKKQIEARNKE